MKKYEELLMFCLVFILGIIGSILVMGTCITFVVKSFYIPTL
jgi:hypothetical protein